MLGQRTPTQTINQPVLGLVGIWGKFYVRYSLLMKVGVLPAKLKWRQRERRPRKALLFVPVLNLTGPTFLAREERRGHHRHHQSTQQLSH
jgi:hypothetical protein